MHHIKHSPTCHRESISSAQIIDSTLGINERQPEALLPIQHYTQLSTRPIHWARDTVKIPAQKPVDSENNYISVSCECLK
jgi:hypothetical protein